MALRRSCVCCQPRPLSRISRRSAIGALFDAATTASGTRSVLCKSFDTQLLLAALSRPAEGTPTALLFRRIADVSFAQQEALTFRSGSIDDVAAIARRGKGCGSHIAAYLKHHYLRQGLRPICGCSTANIPSYRALTAAGFASEHRILQIVRRP